jgi:hypothetical protein
MSTAPRIPRIPTRGPAHLEPQPPRWYECEPLRIVAIVAAGIVAVACAHLFAQLLKALA